MRQANNEAATPAWHAFRGDRAAVRRRNSPRDSQAQPDPRVAELAGRLGAIKRLEDAWEVFGRDATAAIIHRQRTPAARTRRGR